MDEDLEEEVLEPFADDDTAETLDLLDASNFHIHEITEGEIANWLHQEFHSTHPEELVKRTFPENVMKVLANGHHKSRDGVLTIAYDFYAQKWWITHPGYVREVEVQGDSYLSVASDYLSKIDRENGSVMYRGLQDEANKRLAPEYSVEIEDGSMTLFKCERGENRTNTCGTFDTADATVEQIVEQLNEWITAKY